MRASMGLLCGLWLVAGCTTDSEGTDAKSTDPTVEDTGAVDDGDSGDSGEDTGDTGEDTGDTGEDTGDTGEDTGDTGDTGEDTGDTGDGDWPIDGMGTLTGDCGDLFSVELLEDPTPLLFQTELDLGTDGFDVDALSEGGTEVWTDGNLGGSSVESEVVAFEVLYRCEGATLLKTEGEVVYDDPGGKKTDFIVDIDGLKLGVSVTRAVGWPQDDPYTVAQANDLLVDKLGDIPVSTDNVADEDQWVRQILSIVAYAPEHAVSIETAWDSLDAEVRGDTLLMVTATNGDDADLY